MPVERWSVAQVEALAPDPASLRNARGAAGQFSATGLTGDVLWGLCRGYQVAADLAGPAFKCSCPSRKIPCKHVLGRSWRPRRRPSTRWPGRSGRRRRA
ncbi:SWIM zinc finger family protein, partial [Actinoplanes philippinensis]|uniref:SWIM zinc finger family protein n=1 Tax=Actinoplanes philippinensis TaxID=35752 RepID=UPI0033C727E5